MASTYWIKLYHEILHDPKMCRLPDHLYRRCIELFLQAGETDKDGELPSVDDMAWTFRTETELLLDDFKALAVLGIVHESEGKWIVTNFAARQDPDNPAERVARHRERKRKAEYYVTPHTETNPEPVTESVTNVTPTCNESLQDVKRNVTQIRLDTDKIRTDTDIDSAPQPVMQPRQSTRQREPYPNNPAIQAFQDVFKCRPRNREQAAAITEAITESTLDRWKDVLRAWHLHDYKPQNVPGMLDWFRDGIPKNGNGKPHARAGPPEYPHMDIQEVGRLNDLASELPE